MLQQVQICKPRALYICDGTFAEAQEIIHKLEERGTLHKLGKYENKWVPITRTMYTWLYIDS